MKSISLKYTIENPHVAVDFLAEKTELSKSVLKRAMIFGAFWRQRKGNGKKLRFRKAKGELFPGDKVEFHFDPRLLDRDYPHAVELKQTNNWSIWYKPAGLLSQGSLYGDGGSLLRQAELQKKEAFLINRLDREAAGLVLIAWNKNAARELSTLWQHKSVKKFYQVIVKGEMEGKGEISQKLDGKEALTRYNVRHVTDGESCLFVELINGRYHQIRRHLETIGHPVMGDPKYGKGNKNEEGMKLLASKLCFRDPFSRTQIDYELPEEYWLFS